ncbi:MAG TPA: nucleotidyl transferase AbiEii/AbiGii toxin family protein [Phycisphaerae bacterium]|nr:nucleotidyl transferase AbiEii/AbiGii toxin family protein [Phycisphaerae bacterium]HRY71568.1 nucleotidyl transferase AbiEii/AbiGii toxin family protein [Phycisphaerae bacterium]HSA29937.1 nucleotidyl transferase AbiEii/AbiGii toxin family protein [Phycisphaerae bacterium]
MAEKLEAMVKLGELNSRMKGFFDIWLPAGGFDFDGRTLAGAVRRTFDRRHSSPFMQACRKDTLHRHRRLPGLTRSCCW